MARLPFPPPDLGALFDYFRGNWRFTRDIYGAGEALQAQAEGRCSFEAMEAGRLHYAEQGDLRMVQGGRPISFSRLFDYCFDTAGVAVLFADGERVGQPYQRYVLQGAVLGPAADHLCGPDCYNAVYTLQSADGFLMETTIAGPKKATRVLSRFERV